MKSADIRDMRKDELGKKLEELQKQLFTLRTQAVTEKIENSKGISNIRRDIARVKTVIREQELA
jgi:large subunit ribosomal protein L29